MQALQTMFSQRQNLNDVGGEAKVSFLKPGSNTICKAYLFQDLK